MKRLDLATVEKKVSRRFSLGPLTFSVPEGEIVVLLGPSGCGKSTTLRLVSGLDRVSGGTISLGGQVVSGNGTHRDPRKRRVGMVFQSLALWPHMRAVAQLRFVLRGKGLARKEREGRIARSLDLVGLLDRKRAFPHQLSGGELQRLALARALVVDPEIVLLDEPLSAADRALRTRLLLEIRRIQRELRIPMIYVTHDQEEALALADRIVVMREGRIEQDGTPREVYEKPRSRFVASFLGASNVVQARAIGNGGFATPLGEVSCPEADGRQAAWLSIRPEAIEVSPEGVACDVISGTYRGDRWLLQVARQGERFQVFGTSPPEPGQRVGVKIVGGAHLLEDDASVEREGEE